MPCAKPSLCSSRNRFFRVPLSVKRTVPPQLSAVASLPLPRATVGASTSTAITGERDKGNGFPRRFAPRNDNVRGLYTLLRRVRRTYLLRRVRRTYLLRCAAPQKARFDNRPPHRERVSKGRGRARPFPLDASRGRDF